MDETVWAREVAAQKYEETVVKYWDRMLKPEDDKFAVLAEIPFRTITLDAPGDSVELDWGIKRTSFTGTWKKLEPEEWHSETGHKKDQRKDAENLRGARTRRRQKQRDAKDNATARSEVKPGGCLDLAQNRCK